MSWWSITLALSTQTAHATAWVGGNWAGADLLPVDGDTVTGTFTNVGQFIVPAGATVRVLPGTPVEIHATDIVIDGTLEGRGSGSDGGVGAIAGGFDGSAGAGMGPGEGGLLGPCVHGGGGGGGGHGGPGGAGGYLFKGTTAQGGPFNGLEDSFSTDLGSGGGGSGSDCYHAGELGGPGGAAIWLEAVDITIDGTVSANGGDGVDHLLASAGGGGGGSGGTVLLEGGIVGGLGTLTVSGGNGGDTPLGGGWAGGGGGGGGGRIKVFYAALTASFTYDVTGGLPGADQDPATMVFLSQAGQDGSVYEENTDPDVDNDGVLVPFDNCPNDPNPKQEDFDGDDQGDACDPCPIDPYDDTDGDGICDSDDVCPDGPDDTDLDGDGIADDCDICPFDNPDDTDGDGVCDRDDNCPGEDDTIDADGDAYPDICDVCPTVSDNAQTDTDSDGTGDACDCGPTDPGLSRDATEVCDGIDNNCDGETDEIGAEGGTTFYRDDDGDGQGVEDDTIEACYPPDGYADNALDCDDTNEQVAAFAIELCDGLDNDCDGQIEPPELGCEPIAPDEPKGGCGCDGVGGGPAGLALAALVTLVSRRRLASPPEKV